MINVRVKIIFAQESEDLEKAVNEFIEGLDIIDIKFTDVLSETGGGMTAYILYRDGVN